MAAGALTKSFAWSFLEQGGSKAVALVVQVALARLLGPEAFGALAIMLVVTQVADSIAQSGLGLALVQKPDATDDSYSTCWWLSICVALALYVVIFAISPGIEAFYGMPGLAGCLRVLGLTVVANAANSIQRSYLQRAMDFRRLFRVSLFAVASSGAVGVLLAAAGAGTWALVAQAVAQSVLTLLAMLASVPWKPRLTFSTAEAGEMFSYGWKVCVTGVLGVLYTGVSELVIGRACSAGELGYYSQGRKYPMAAISVVQHSVQNVMFPALAALKGDAAAFRAMAGRALAVGTFAVAPVALCMAAVAEPIVALLLTEKWLPCVPVFQMVCISHCTLMLTAVNLRAYMALGRSDLYLWLQAVKVLLGGSAICAAAVVTRDVYATALVTCVVTLFNSVVLDVLPAARVYGYPASRQYRDVAPALACAMAAGAASYAVAMTGIPYAGMLLVQLVLFAAVYLLLAKLMKLEAYAQALRILSDMRR